MSVGVLLLGLLVVGILIIAGVVVSNIFSPDNRESRKEIAEANAAAKVERNRAAIATKALRAIANGAGSPILEASDALDQIERTYENKELN